MVSNGWSDFRVDRADRVPVKQDQQPHNTVPILVQDLEVVLLPLVTTVHNQAVVNHRAEQLRMGIKVTEPTDKPLPMDSSSSIQKERYLTLILSIFFQTFSLVFPISARGKRSISILSRNANEIFL